MSPKVSIISPCFNGEEYVGRFLDSVLNQTYTDFEMILINDGSTDKTEEIILSYKKRFEEREIPFIYIYQENAGLSSAINSGLKVFQGEYLTWPDSDDILYENYLEVKVNFMEENKDCALLFSQCDIVNENDINKKIGTLKRTLIKGKKDNLFEDLILEKNVFFTSIGTFLRSSAFLDVIPDRHIYESRIGQNWQMLLPVAYKHKFGYINNILATYVVRENSLSHRDKTLKDILEKNKNFEDILISTINKINMSNKQYYLNMIEKKYKIRKIKFTIKSFIKSILKILKIKYK